MRFYFVYESYLFCILLVMKNVIMIINDIIPGTNAIKQQYCYDSWSEIVHKYVNEAEKLSSVLKFYKQFKIMFCFRFCSKTKFIIPWNCLRKFEIMFEENLEILSLVGNGGPSVTRTRDLTLISRELRAVS